MQNLSLDVMKVPLRQFMDGDEVVSGVHIDFREEADDHVGDIELLLIPLGRRVNLMSAGEEKEDNNCDGCVS